MKLPEAMERLIESFMRLPGIGEKTAGRLAYNILSMQEEYVYEFSKSLIAVIRELKNCKTCGGLSEKDTCEICANLAREKDTICVLQNFQDVMALERTGEYHGVYHVLNGVISPLEGKGPDDLNLSTLASRVESSNVKEVILATNPNVEGEATALYICNMLAPYNVKVTRIAHGLPVGGDLEYADEVTLIRALQGRQSIS